MKTDALQNGQTGDSNAPAAPAAATPAAAPAASPAPRKRTRSKALPVVKDRFRITTFTNPSKGTAYRVQGYLPDNSRIRENYKTMAEAVARKSELDIQSANIVTTTASRLRATRLTDAELLDAERALAKMREKFPDKTLLFCAEYVIANFREAVQQITVADAIAKFLADRAKQNRRPDTLRNLRGRLGMFKDFYGAKQVAEVTLDDCRDFVFRDGTSPRNRINDRLAASNFLNWCVRRQFAPANLMAQVDKPAVDAEEPSVLAVADCRNLLSAARDYKDGLLLPYVVVSLFAGLRPTEISRLTWSRIDLKEGTITLDGSMAKTRQRRIVKLSENAIAWLLPLAPRHPAFVPAAFARHFGRVKRTAGFNGKEVAKADQDKLRPWVQDYLRHTAVSMYLAKHKHEGEAASWAGNSPNVIHKHYKGMVKEADATEFWSLTPETIKSEIIKLPAAKAA